MFLITQEILESVLYGNYGNDEACECIEKFKEEVIKEIDSNKHIIINAHIKFLIDKKNYSIDGKELKSIYIEKNKSECAKQNDFIYNNQLITEYFMKLLSEIDIDGRINELENKISKIVKDKNYEEALKVSNLKYLFKSKTKEQFDLNYEKICLNKIKDNKDLRKKLRNKYFSELSSELNISE